MKRKLWPALLLILPLAACGGRELSIAIRVPPGNEGFVYSHEEVSSGSGKITLSCGEGLGDTEASLLPADDTRPPEPFYLTPGMPATVEVEKGKWYKVGVNVRGDGDGERTVYVNVNGATVRIE